MRLSAVLPGASDGCGTIETRRIVSVNAPPAPVIDAPDRIAAGALTLFDAGASADPGGAVTHFAWDFGDGATATGVQAQHRFATSGTFRVRLAVTDDAGVGNSRVEAVRPVEVTPPPEAGLTAPPALRPGMPHAWTVAGDAGDLKETWLFGDGVAIDGPATSHAFDKPGVFPVTVTLDDGGGLDSSLAQRGGLRPRQPPPDRRGRPRPRRLPRRQRRLRRRPLRRPRRPDHRLELALQRRRGADGQQVEHRFDTPGPRGAR